MPNPNDLTKNSRSTNKVGRVFLISLVLFFLFGFAIFFTRNFLVALILEDTLNSTLRESFDDSIRIESLTLDQYLQIHAQNISGSITTPDGVIPVQIAKMDSEGSALGALTGAPLLMKIRGIKIAETKGKGLSTYMLIERFPQSTVDMRIIVQGFNLEDLAQIDPVRFKGLAGILKGRIRIVAGPDKDPLVEMKLEVKEPGGKMPESMLQTLKPYLPPTVWQARNSSLEKREWVYFQQASIKGNLISGDLMKILFNLYVKDYNINLNLNLEIRMDEKNGFFELIRQIGLIQGKQS